MSPARSPQMRTNERPSPLYVVLRPAGRSSRWPARLDLLQSGSGLALGLFMWVHMFFVSSILLGRDAMWTVARFFEGYFVFGRPLPWLVSLLVATIFALFIGHAALALRKFPASYRQYRTYREHMGSHEARRHLALVLAGGHRVRAVLHGLGAPLHHDDPSRAHRAVRVRRPRLDRPDVAALPRHAVRGRVPRRHRAVPARAQVGLVRRQ